jgi:hypothetical protein
MSRETATEMNSPVTRLSSSRLSRSRPGVRFPCRGELQASSGIAMGVLLGAGSWIILAGFTFLVLN